MYAIGASLLLKFYAGMRECVGIVERHVDNAFCAFPVCMWFSWWGCGVLPLWPDRGFTNRGQRGQNAKILENYPQNGSIF